jgi:hypothetical protein
MSLIAAFNTPACDDCPYPRESYRRGQCGLIIRVPGKECRVADAAMAPSIPGETQTFPRPGGPYADVRNAPWLSDEEFRKSGNPNGVFY